MANLQALAAPTLLSIQSHVVHGYVGNKCAVFPLQLLGFDVDPLNSVQFSNHTGYASWKGAVFDGQHLLSLVEGLKHNGLLSYTHLLTGYIGSLSLLEAVVRVVEELRAANPGLTYVCDPVMGDDGKLYVAEELVAAFRKSIVPLASVLTPNQFEAELLTGISVQSEQDALRACQALHDLGPHTVVISSISSPNDTITLIASTTQTQQAGPQRLKLFIPRLPAYFTGTGDLLAALLVGWLHRHPGNLALAVEKAVAGLQAVLHNTVAAAQVACPSCAPQDLSMASKELRLIQSQEHLRNPDIKLRCQPL